MKSPVNKIVLFGVIFAFVISGCAHVDENKKSSAVGSVAEYYPLAVGNSWTYTTTFLEQDQADLVVSIVKEENGYFIDNRPTPSKLKFDGIGLRDGSIRYLLKGPVTKGNKWMSVADVRTVERYEITGIDEKIKVPAGVFDKCVKVEMEVKMTETRSMVNQMIFAPGVGIVRIKTHMKEGAKQVPQTMMALKTYQIK